MELNDLLHRPLMTISGTVITAVTLLVILLVIAVTFMFSRFGQRGLERWLGGRETSDSGTVATVSRLFHYAVMIIGFGIALQTLGISLGTLFTAGAFFAIAIGFAMQSIAQNFVSGIILLAERTIKPGDVLEVEGQTVRVTSMSMRATVARTRDDEDLIIPNATLVQNTITNFTLRDPLIRIRSKIGVAYGTDIRRATEILEAAAATLDPDAPQPPRALLIEFADSSVVFEVSIWTTDPWNLRVTRSDLNVALYEAVYNAGIIIPFPQRDVHIIPGVDVRSS